MLVKVTIAVIRLVDINLNDYFLGVAVYGKRLCMSRSNNCNAPEQFSAIADLVGCVHFVNAPYLMFKIRALR